ncbi:glycosyltransferase [Comamonas sp.]|uniref:glycosyltransferase n=1 Tax=Comamonas sp. TaxID=34028 RepID=UPI00264A066F|nr:glycosyltransferase [Comamonas sp.]MDN5537300.1 glycosyltransferase [Comamonas sp.]
MHILIVPSEHFVTKRIPLGGIFQFEQAKALARAGHRVGIIGVGFVSLRYFCGGYSYQASEQLPSVTIVREYRRIFLPHRLYWVPLIVRKYTGLFERNYIRYVKANGVPDVIHAHNSIFGGLIGQYIKRKYGVPYVLTEHSSAFARGMVSTAMIARLQSVFSQAGAVTCVSTPFSRELAQICPVPVSVLPNMVDPLFTHGEIARRNDEQFHWLSVASLDSNKNHELALRAFAAAFRGQAARFTIVGDGPLYARLAELCVALGISEQVSFLGQLSRDAVREAMAKADCLVSSSNYETFGVVLIEALACGLPVVATRCGGPDDIVRSSNGILVDVGDCEQLASAMRQMAETHEGYPKEQLRREALERFGEHSFVAQAVALYENAKRGH